LRSIAFWRSPRGKVVQDKLAGTGTDFARAHENRIGVLIREPSKNDLPLDQALEVRL
jgi:hypothetical protein